MPVITKKKVSFGKKNKKKKSTSFIQDIVNPFIKKRKRDRKAKKEKKKRKKIVKNKKKKTKMNKGLKAMMKKKHLSCK